MKLSIVRTVLPYMTTACIFWVGLNSTPVVAQTTFEVRVLTSSDDAEEVASGGAMDLTSSDLELTHEGGTQQVVGMRFTSVNVAKGATVSSAYIQFQVDEATTGASSLTIRGEDIDDAPTFTTTAGDISSRTNTTASVAWSPPDWNTVDEAGADQRTADISSIIQEIIDRPGWSSGNDLVIMITGTGTRIAEAYDGDSAAAALLHVEYDGVPPPPGLQGHWKLDEITGTSAADSSANSNNGTVIDHGHRPWLWLAPQSGAG